MKPEHRHSVGDQGSLRHPPAGLLRIDRIKPEAVANQRHAGLRRLDPVNQNAGAVWGVEEKNPANRDGTGLRCREWRTVHTELLRIIRDLRQRRLTPNGRKGIREEAEAGIDRLAVDSLIAGLQNHGVVTKQGKAQLVHACRKGRLAGPRQPDDDQCALRTRDRARVEYQVALMRDNAWDDLIVKQMADRVGRERPPTADCDGLATNVDGEIGEVGE